MTDQAIKDLEMIKNFEREQKHLRWEENKKWRHTNQK